MTRGARSTPTATDRRLLRRASLVIAVQTGVAAAAVVAIVIALVYVISLEARLDAIEGKVRDKAENAGEYGADLTARAPLVTDGLPADCTEGDVGDAVAALPLGTSRVEACGVDFLAHRVEAEGTTVSAAVSIVDLQEETGRLARLSIGVGLLGVLVAAGFGWLVGRRAVRPLGDALTAQRRFVADASHELRTPLAIMLTRAQLMQRGPSYDDEQRRELGLLVHDTRVLSDVVDDMLLVAEMQHLPRPTEPVDLDELVADVRASFAARAAGAQVTLTIEPGEPAVPGEPGEPGASEDDRRRREHVVPGTARALRRAVAALVDNALGFVEPGGRVVVAVTRVGRAVHVRVSDDGAGLDPAHAAELTQRFRRGPGAGSEGDRLGLGLALVSEVVHAHGGTMDIDGAIGVGAVVTLRLPASDPGPGPGPGPGGPGPGERAGEPVARHPVDVPTSPTVDRVTRHPGPAAG